MHLYHFDDRNILWQNLEGIEHLQYSILDIDEPNLIIDVLFKLAAGKQIVLHRHLALNKTLVLQGDHRLYHADGQVKEIRPCGTYKICPPSEEPHREGGGEQDAIVLFSIRGSAGVLYEILDDANQVVAKLEFADFKSLHQQQCLNEGSKHHETV